VRLSYLGIHDDARQLEKTMVDQHLGWSLSRRSATRFGEIAWDVLGAGPPLVLVHGTPASSYLWRHIAPALAEDHTVHVFDLVGFGSSERRLEQRLGIAVHASVLAELVDQWELDRPVLVGHDFGAAAALRAHLVDEVSVSALALLAAPVIRPYITPATRHMQEHLDAYQTMPNDVFAELAAAHLRRAVVHPMSDEDFDAAFGQWSGERGQALWLRNVAQHDERETAEFEDRLGTIAAPCLILSGAEDRWVDPASATTLQDRIPGSERHIIPDAGHFLMEDQPNAVTQRLRTFLASLP
jgi:pimeloyl-ACP methyl ester carboxylesterase